MNYTLTVKRNLPRSMSYHRMKSARDGISFFKITKLLYCWKRLMLILSFSQKFLRSSKKWLCSQRHVSSCL